MKKTMQGFIGTRICQDDYTKFVQAADEENMTVSELNRALIFSYMQNRNPNIYKTSESEKNSRRIERNEEVLLYKDLINEVNRIGINVNQIAARVNAGVVLHNDFLELRNKLDEIYTLLDNFRR